MIRDPPNLLRLSILAWSLQTVSFPHPVWQPSSLLWCHTHTHIWGRQLWGKNKQWSLIWTAVLKNGDSPLLHLEGCVPPQIVSSLEICVAPGSVKEPTTPWYYSEEEFQWLAVCSWSATGIVPVIRDGALAVIYSYLSLVWTAVYIVKGPLAPRCRHDKSIGRKMCDCVLAIWWLHSFHKLCQNYMHWYKRPQSSR